MSSITSANSSGYYQLANSSSNNDNTAEATSTTNMLLNALEGNSADTSSANSAYSLNLSPEAQSYLSGSTSSTSTANPLTGSSNFTLSSAQQKEIAAIIAKYKDAPYTQTTFDNIQSDLNAAGLGTNTLQEEDQAQNFNSTALLIDDLSGNYSDSATQPVSASSEQSKSSNYMQSIISQWQSTSSTYSATAASTTNITS